jgi:hypothetical protein
MDIPLTNNRVKVDVGTISREVPFQIDIYAESYDYVQSRQLRHNIRMVASSVVGNWLRVEIEQRTTDAMNCDSWVALDEKSIPAPILKDLMSQAESRIFSWYRWEGAEDDE